MSSPDATVKPSLTPDEGWRAASPTPSLPEVHGTIPVPKHFSFWRKLLAFSGPGYLVAVGYMDPGNWATDLAGGSKFGYTLLSVILISNLMAILLQSLCAKLGIVTTGKAYNDVRQALEDLGIDEAEAQRIGVGLFKVNMPWPLEPTQIAKFARGLKEIAKF